MKLDLRTLTIYVSNEHLSGEAHRHNVGNVRLLEGVSWGCLGCRGWSTWAPRFWFIGVHAMVWGRPEVDIDKGCNWWKYQDCQLETLQVPLPVVCPQDCQPLWQKLSELLLLLHLLLQLQTAWESEWDFVSWKCLEMQLSFHNVNLLLT